MSTNNEYRSIESRYDEEMKVRLLNVPLLIVTIIAMMVLAPAAYSWHGLQLRRIATTLLDRAELLANSADWNAAAEYVYRYLQLRPDDAAARIRLANLYDKSAISVDDKTRAVELYYQAIGVAPDAEQPALRHRLAELLIELQRFNEAQQEAQKIIAALGDDPASYRLMALALFGQFKPGQQVEQDHGLTAGEALDRAVALNPRDTELARTWAEVLRHHPKLLSESQRRTLDTKQSREDKADSVMDTLVRDNINDPTAYIARYSYRSRNQLIGVEEDLEQALRLGSDRADVVTVAANHHRQAVAAAAKRGAPESEIAGLAGKAIAYYVRLTDELAPKDPLVYLGLSELYQNSGDAEKSIQIIRQGLERIGDSNLPLNATFAEKLISAGQLAEAEKILRRLDDHEKELRRHWNDNSRLAWDRYRDLLLATLHLKKGDFLKVIPLVKPITSSNFSESSEQLRAWLVLGETLAKLGEWDQAAIAFEAAAVLDGQNVQLRVAAAEAWVRAGQPGSATKHLEIAFNRTKSLELGTQLAASWFLHQSSLPPRRRDWTAFEQTLAKVTGTDDWKKLTNPWRIELLQADYAHVRGKEGDASSNAAARAIEILKDAEQRYPKDLPFWRELPLRYERLGSPNETDLALARCFQLNDSSADACLIASRIYSGRKDLARARQVLLDSLNTLPANQQPAVHAGVAELALFEGNLDEAQRELSQLIRDDAPNLVLARQLAELALDAGKLDVAKQWEDRLREMEGPEGTYWRYLRAIRLLREDRTKEDSRFDEVVRLQEEIQKRRPSWAIGYALHGSISEVQGEPLRAISAYQTAVRLGDSRINVYERLISLLYQQGRFAEADDYLSRLDDHISSSDRLSPLAISVATGLKDFSRAQSVAKRSIDRRPMDPMAWVWYGQVLQLNKQSRESEQAFRKAIELAPKDVRTWNGLFSFHLRSNQREAAGQTLQQLAQTAELSEAQRAFVLAQGNEMLGDIQQASEQYREATKLAPDSVPIWAQFCAFLLLHDRLHAELPLRRLAELAAQSEASRPFADNARRALAALLTARGAEGDFNEAMKLLQQSGADKRSMDVDERLQAVLLTQRLNPDLVRAQELLENLVFNRKTGVDGDYLLLAWVYAKQSESLTGDARTSKLAAARQQYETLCLRPSPQIPHLAVYVDFLMRQKQWNDADRSLIRLEKLAGDEPRTILLRAQWLHLQKRDDEVSTLVEANAQRLATQAMDDSQRLQMYTTLGNIYSNTQMYVAAEPWYRKARTLDPKRYSQLANSLLAQGKKAEAIQLCHEEAAKTATAEAAAVLAIVLTEARADDETLRTCQPLLDKSLVTFPQEPGLLVSLANLRVMQHRMDDAIGLYRSALRFSPNNVIAMNNLATLLSESPGKAEEALRYIDQAIQLSGPQAALLDTKGMALVHDNRPAEAIDLLQQAAASPSSDPRFHFHLAVALHRVGDHDEARTAFQAAVDQKLKQQILTDTDVRLMEELELVLK